MTEKRRCPKCKGEMVKQDVPYALVQYVKQEDRTHDGAQINPKSALPVEVYRCDGCHYVELLGE